MKGNEAIAEAAVAAGCRHYFGYPITPQTEIAAYMAKRMPKIGGTFLQAESEVAAINMVAGAAAAGVRTMTSSSSPGVALKSEGISYIAGMDIPALVVNIMRAGPGLGGIQPSQGDYWQCVKGGGHGDYRNIVLAPSGVQEMYDFTKLAFDLADKYRMCAMILSDGVLGQMMEPVAVSASDAPPFCADGKPWALTGTKGARKPNIINSLYIEPDTLEVLLDKRYAEKYAACEANEVRWDEFLTDDAEIVVTAYGAPARIARSAVTAARAKGIKAGLLRPITLWPFPKVPLAQLAETAKAFVCVELSKGQMIDDIRLAIECKRPVSLCTRTGGNVPSPEEILTAIENAAKEAV
jgi:2-oxoglutarate ferredoxin oxidoreductase subunit alpha